MSPSRPFTLISAFSLKYLVYIPKHLKCIYYMTVPCNMESNDFFLCHKFHFGRIIFSVTWVSMLIFDWLWSCSSPIEDSIGGLKKITFKHIIVKKLQFASISTKKTTLQSSWERSVVGTAPRLSLCPLTVQVPRVGALVLRLLYLPRSSCPIAGNNLRERT